MQVNGILEVHGLQVFVDSFGFSLFVSIRLTHLYFDSIEFHNMQRRLNQPMAIIASEGVSGRVCLQKRYRLVARRR